MSHSGKAKVLELLRPAVDATFRKTVKIHHSRVTQHFGQFVEHLVGVQQNVIGLDEPDKEVKGQSSCTVVRANEDYGVENDSQ